MMRRILSLAAVAALAVVIGLVAMPSANASVSAKAGASAGSSATAAVSWPCSPTARSRACVDLSSKKAWLRYRGTTTVYGPVPISSGKAGYRTPTGTFTVKFKDKDYWSKQFDAPMPYAVFFTWNGHAFHYGSVYQQSHGCIHLTMTPARKFFWHLSPGDVVQIRA